VREGITVVIAGRPNAGKSSYKLFKWKRNSVTEFLVPRVIFCANKFKLMACRYILSIQLDCVTAMTLSNRRMRRAWKEIEKRSVLLLVDATNI
jgi:hypothetical protein